MGIAKIYVSVYNVEDKQSVVLQLEASNQKLRQSLANRVKRHMRRVPELNFYLDDTLDEMYRLNGLFNRLGKDKKPDSNLDDLSKEL
jgi:Ribosome-binding factor A